MQYNPAHLPDDCRDIHDIRTEIDQIDHFIIRLLSTRLNYVKKASEFKTSHAEVQSKDRVNNMLKQRQQWADELGLDGEIIKELYSGLVRYFIAEELKNVPNGLAHQPVKQSDCA